MGNKLFTKENIQSLICFAIQFTKEKVLIWIPGRIESVNYYYFDGKRRADALKIGFANEERYTKLVQEIISRLPTEHQNKLSIVHYDDVLSPRFVKQRETLFRGFSEQRKLYDDIIAVARDIVEARKRTADIRLLESVAIYVIQELPLFLDGLQVIGNEKTVYGVVLYPGMGKLDYLVERIKYEQEYEELRKKLNLKYPSGIINIEFEI